MQNAVCRRFIEERTDDRMKIQEAWEGNMGEETERDESAK
jgi:hypothetical protein